MFTPVGRNPLPALILGAALLAALAACGDDDEDDCIPCSLSGNASECPVIHKVCSWGTMDVQECSGSGSKGCCTTDPADISCDFLAGLATSGSFEIAGGLVRFLRPEGGGTFCTAVDPVSSGWVPAGLDEEAWRPLVAERLATIARAAGAPAAERAWSPPAPRSATPVDPGGSR